MRPFLTLLLMTCLAATIGCAGDDPQLSTWQKQQVEHVQRQTEHNTAAAKALVEADAKARQQLVTLQREIQAERAEVGRQRDTIETERKALADERQRAPLIAAVVHGAGLVLLAALPLVICWLLLKNPASPAEASELENELILNLAGEASTLAPSLQLTGPAKPGNVPTLTVENHSDDSSRALSDCA